MNFHLKFCEKFEGWKGRHLASLRHWGHMNCGISLAGCKTDDFI